MLRGLFCFLLPHPNRETTVLTCYNYRHLSPLNYSSSSNFETRTHTYTCIHFTQGFLSIWVLKFISSWCNSVSSLWVPTTNYSLIKIQIMNQNAEGGKKSALLFYMVFQRYQNIINLFLYLIVSCQFTINNLRVLKVGFLENISDLYISVNQRLVTKCKP